MLSGEEIASAGLVRPAEAAIAPASALLEAIHVQPNGVDLSLDGVWRLMEAGALGRGNAERHLPAREPLDFVEDGEWLSLAPGSYGIRYAEWVEPS